MVADRVSIGDDEEKRDGGSDRKTCGRGSMVTIFHAFRYFTAYNRSRAS
jgi:hypothetical protein